MLNSLLAKSIPYGNLFMYSFYNVKERGNMQIIKATLEHADLIGYIHSNAWQSAYRDIFPKEYLAADTIAGRKAEFIDSLAYDNINYYLVSVDDNAVGIVKVKTEDKKCEVSALYFLEEYKNRGFGTETLSHIKNIYQGCRIVLWVLKDNLKARKFYEKNRFVETGETRTIDRGNEYIQVKYECQM